MYYVLMSKHAAILSDSYVFSAARFGKAFTISEYKVFYFKRGAIQCHCVADVTCTQEWDDVGIWGVALLQNYVIN